METVDIEVKLHGEIMQRLDITAAVLIALADAGDLWPVSINAFVKQYPYLDHRTCRYRWDRLAAQGYVVKTKGRNHQNQAVVTYEKK
jgi:hypothetical protein